MVLFSIDFHLIKITKKKKKKFSAENKFDEKKKEEELVDIEENEEEFDLIFSKQFPMKLKDIAKERKAKEDLMEFAKSDKSLIFLNQDLENPIDIADRFLLEFQNIGKLTKEQIEECKKDILTNESGIPQNFFFFIKFFFFFLVPKFRSLLFGRDKHNETRNFSVIVCELNGIKDRLVGYMRLNKNMNLGNNKFVRHFFIVIASPFEKKTKNSLETSNTFASMLSDSSLHFDLENANSVEEVRTIVREYVGKIILF